MREGTIISMDQVAKIAAKTGLVPSKGKAETKWYHPATGIKRSIAVPNTKKGATRVYLVGFEAKEGTVAHPKPPAGTVTQMFDHSLPASLLLRAIYKAARSLSAASSPVAETVGVTEAPAVPEAASQVA
jgi:hypothetical protein